MSTRTRRAASLTAALTLAVAALAAPSAAPTAARPAERPAADEAADAAAAEGMFTRLNDARVAAGLRPYRHSPLLAEVAAAHAREVAEHNHFSHTGRDGRSAKQRMADAGYGAGRTGVRTSENFVARATVDEGFAWLMSDADHRPNMMDARFREVGVGVAPTRYGYVWVLDFGMYDGVDDVPPPAAAAATTGAPEATAATSALSVTAGAAITSSAAISATAPVTAAVDAGASDVVTATDPVTAAVAPTDAGASAVVADPAAPTATTSAGPERGDGELSAPTSRSAPRGLLLLVVAALLTLTGLGVATFRPRRVRRP